jgi:hypothetical protein
MTEHDIVIERSVNNFYFNEDSLALEFNGEVLEEPFKRGWLSLISS